MSPLPETATPDGCQAALPRSRREFGPVFELRRALDARSLWIGFAAALALGVATYFAANSRLVEAATRLMDFTPIPMSLLVAAIAFVAVGFFHVALHVYLGWRFARGIAAAGARRNAAARRLLAPRATRLARHGAL